MKIGPSSEEPDGSPDDDAASVGEGVDISQIIVYVNPYKEQKSNC